MLPNFFIVGANKAGTTSLHNYLASHPEIFMSRIKEPMYFTLKDATEEKKRKYAEQNQMNNAIYTVEDYQDLFKESIGYKAIGESSTAYLGNPKAPKEIKKEIPSAKIIILLREPIDRAISNYKMYVDWGLEHDSFESVISKILAKKELEKPGRKMYLGIGLYAEAVKRYINLFSAERVRVYLFDDFKKYPEAILRDLCHFLAVDEKFKFETKQIFNQSKGYKPIWVPEIPKFLRPFLKLLPNGAKSTVKSTLTIKPKISYLRSPELIAKLKAFYKDDILELEKIIQKDLTAWKTRTEWY
jgi:hypothetical protein